MRKNGLRPFENFRFISIDKRSRDIYLKISRKSIIKYMMKTNDCSCNKLKIELKGTILLG